MNHEKRISRRSMTLIIITLAVGMACLCIPGGNIAPTSTRPLSIPTATETPSPTQPQGPAALQYGGPWLLMITNNGLWAANPDGSAVTQLTSENYWNERLKDAIQPGGNQVVFITPGGYDIHHLALNILSLPDGKITKITDLTSPETEAYADLGLGETGFDALRAVAEQRSYAWSPDGTKLAFIGVMDGPTAEVYLYDAITRQISRVSHDNAQNYWPSWSPDGRYLVYLGAETFGTGAGYLMTGVWSARGDGTNVTRLYTPKSAGEEIIGWRDDATVVLDSWNIDCGRAELRLYDVSTTREVMLNEGCFISAAANSWQNTVMFANENGLYFLAADSETPTLISQEAVAQIDEWGVRNDLFIVRFADGRIETFSMADIEHQVSPIRVPGEGIDVAYGTLTWGWTSANDEQPGVWITGPGMDIGQIFSGEAYLPIWDAHNNLLFIAPEGGRSSRIYRATYDAYYQDPTPVGLVNTVVYDAYWAGVK